MLKQCIYNIAIWKVQKTRSWLSIFGSVRLKQFEIICPLENITIKFYILLAFHTKKIYIRSQISKRFLQWKIINGCVYKYLFWHIYKHLTKISTLIEEVLCKKRVPDFTVDKSLIEILLATRTADLSQQNR